MLRGNRDLPQIADYLLEISIFARMCLQKSVFVSIVLKHLIWILLMWNLQGETHTHVNRQMSLGIMQSGRNLAVKLQPSQIFFHPAPKTILKLHQYIIMSRRND